MNNLGVSSVLSEKKLNTWISYYSKRNSIEVKIDNSLEAAAAINLEDIDKPVIYFNPKLIKEKFNLSEEEVYFTLFQEIEHLKEQIEILSTSNGQKINTQKEAKFKNLEKTPNLYESLHLLENFFRDIFVNNSVISSNNIPVLKDARYSLYKNSLFKDTDYLNTPVYDQDGNIVEYRPIPKHLQFVYTILREAMIVDEKCVIDQKIRKIIKRLDINKSIELSTEGKFEDRLQNLWNRIEPIYKKLLDEDLKELENKEPGEGEKKGEQEKSKNSGNLSDGILSSFKKKIKDLLGNDKDSNTSESKTGENKNNNLNEGQEGKDSGEGQENNTPKNPFENYYKDIKEIPHVIEDAIGKEELDKIKQKIAEAKISKNKLKSKEDLELEQRVRNMGIDDKDKNFDILKQNLKKYNDFLKQLENLKDSKTGEMVMDEIENMFKLIKSKRLKPKYKSRGPVDIERGVRLDPNTIALGIASIKSGNLNPEIFLEDYKEEKERDFVGRFDLSIVADGSGSMEGEKNRQQKIAILAILEALKRLHDRLDDEKNDMKSETSFNTEGFIFGNGVKRFKEFSSDFSDKERLNSYSLLDNDNGTTNDFESLQEIIDDYDLQDNQYQASVMIGKTKKIVIVMTDGESNNEYILKENIQKLREQGILVYGIGITSGGESVESVYSGDNQKLGFGKVCYKVEDLATTLKDLLKEHLENL